MKSDITPKSTKAEVLGAYNKLIKEQENLLSRDRLEEKEDSTKIDKVAKATKNDKKDIIHKIADLKIDINSSLDDLSKNLVEEKIKLDEIQEAKKIESGNLEDLYEIKTNAKTLEALLISQKKQKEVFEEEIERRKIELERDIADKKIKWDKEQEDHNIQEKEKIRLLKIEKAREEDEYHYKIKIRDQKDKDDYEQKKIKIERELEQKQKQVNDDIGRRLEAIKGQEEELKELREAKKSYDKDLKDAAETAKSETIKQLEIRYKYESQLKAKDSDATISLLNQTILSLKEKLAEKEKVLESMQKQVGASQSHSQELAKKVVEGVSSVTSMKNAFINQNSENKENK